MADVPHTRFPGGDDDARLAATDAVPQAVAGDPRPNRFPDPTESDAMILEVHPSYPSASSYVLKLHRDAAPARGRIFGRLENIATGEQFAFSNAEELLACLVRDTRSPKA